MDFFLPRSSKSTGRVSQGLRSWFKMANQRIIMIFTTLSTGQDPVLGFLPSAASFSEKRHKENELTHIYIPAQVLWWASDGWRGCNGNGCGIKGLGGWIQITVLHACLPQQAGHSLEPPSQAVHIRCHRRPLQPSGLTDGVQCMALKKS